MTAISKNEFIDIKPANVKSSTHIELDIENDIKFLHLKFEIV